MIPQRFTIANPMRIGLTVSARGAESSEKASVSKRARVWPIEETIGKLKYSS